MTAGLFLATAAAGGLGAALRFVLDAVIRVRVGSAYPLGILVINLTGSLLLGLLTGLAVGSVVPDAWRLVLGTGFLGGYTTFSTASVDTVRLVQEGRTRAAVMNGLGMLVAGVILAGLGYAVGSSL